MNPQFIKEVPDLKNFVDRLSALEGTGSILYIDLEGKNLSRQGTISLITVLVEESQVFLVDVTTLQQEAFNTQGTSGRTLRDILESDQITKVSFDIRNDSDALYSLYGVRVGGTEDLQLLELVSRTSKKEHVKGLERCIESDGRMTETEKERWIQVKNAGRQAFAPEFGGRYEVFDERPLKPAIMEYCANDVTYLPDLYRTYRDGLSEASLKKVHKATLDRIALSQSADYYGHGYHMALAPLELRD